MTMQELRIENLTPAPLFQFNSFQNGTVSCLATQDPFFSVARSIEPTIPLVTPGERLAGQVTNHLVKIFPSPEGPNDPVTLDVVRLFVECRHHYADIMMLDVSQIDYRAVRMNSVSDTGYLNLIRKIPVLVLSDFLNLHARFDEAKDVVQAVVLSRSDGLTRYTLITGDSIHGDENLRRLVKQLGHG